jgi:hypothetical protein
MPKNRQWHCEIGLEHPKIVDLFSSSSLDDGVCFYPRTGKNWRLFRNSEEGFGRRMVPWLNESNDSMNE